MPPSNDPFHRWHPGIGDPTIIGWLTVLAYFIAMWLCWRALLTVLQARPGALRDRNRLAFFWGFLVLLLLFLGFNKQLDLQSLFTQVGRDLAIAQGWYDQRRQYQLVFIVGIAAISLTVSVAMAVWLRRHLRDLIVGLIGLVALFSFITIRAASFHHIDAWIGARMPGYRFDSLMELGGIALIAYSAVLQRRRIARQRPRVRRGYGY